MHECDDKNPVRFNQVKKFAGKPLDETFPHRATQSRPCLGVRADPVQRRKKPTIKPHCELVRLALIRRDGGLKFGIRFVVKDHLHSPGCRRAFAIESSTVTPATFPDRSSSPRHSAKSAHFESSAVSGPSSETAIRSHSSSRSAADNSPAADMSCSRVCTVTSVRRRTLDSTPEVTPSDRRPAA